MSRLTSFSPPHALLRNTGTLSACTNYSPIKVPPKANNSRGVLACFPRTKSLHCLLLCKQNAQSIMKDLIQDRDMQEKYNTISSRAYLQANVLQWSQESHSYTYVPSESEGSTSTTAEDDLWIDNHSRSIFWRRPLEWFVFFTACNWLVVLFLVRPVLPSNSLI